MESGGEFLCRMQEMIKIWAIIVTTMEEMAG